MAELKDSGARRDFGTGAVRDIAEMRKGCDITDAANTALHGALEASQRGADAAVEDIYKAEAEKALKGGTA